MGLKFLGETEDKVRESKPKKPLIYLCIYGRIKKREANGENACIVHISKISPIIRETARIPRRYHLDVLKELVDYGLLRKINRDNYAVLPLDTKPLCDSLGEPLW